MTARALQLSEIRGFSLLAILAGSFWLALTAQVSLSLPFTPVPITGQTFGVMLLALTMGRKIAFGAFATYLVEGAMGLPVFAHGHNLAMVGPTLGYLFGMLGATYVVGFAADFGARRSFWWSLGSCYLGSLCIFTFGAFGLQFFVPSSAVFAVGVAPFLIGDFIKNATAAFIASRIKD